MRRADRLPTLILTLLPLCVSPASAAGVFRLSWNGCADDRASLQRCYDCDGKAGAPFVFQGSFRPANSIPDFAGCSIEVQITFQDAGGGVVPVPDLWKVGAGSCAGGTLTAVNPTTDGGCSTPSVYGANPSGGWAVYYPFGYSAGEMLIRVDWTTGPTPGGALVAGQLYPGFAVAMDVDAAIAAGCAGCSTRATLQLQKIEVYGFTLGEDEVITTPETRDWILWQDSSAYPCLSTPARAPSWGAIKAMYR